MKRFRMGGSPYLPIELLPQRAPWGLGRGQDLSLRWRRVWERRFPKGLEADPSPMASWIKQWEWKSLHSNRDSAPRYSVQPPSITKNCPVMKALSSLAR
jgi:hypothetical protein